MFDKGVDAIFKVPMATYTPTAMTRDIRTGTVWKWVPDCDWDPNWLAQYHNEYMRARAAQALTRT